MSNPLANHSLRESGRRKLFWRGVLMIGFAVLAVLVSASAPTLQSLFQRYSAAAVIPTAIFAGAVLWFLYQRFYSIPNYWQRLEVWDIAGDSPRDSAVQFYQIFVLYVWTKRLLMYGSVIGAIAILFGGLGVSANWLTWNSIKFYAAIGDAVAGLVCIWLSYVIGRQVRPAKLLAQKVLWLILWGNDKGGDTSEQLHDRSDTLLAEIEKQNPVWFQ